MYVMLMFYTNKKIFSSKSSYLNREKEKDKEKNSTIPKISLYEKKAHIPSNFNLYPESHSTKKFIVEQ